MKAWFLTYRREILETLLYTLLYFFLFLVIVLAQKRYDEATYKPYNPLAEVNKYVLPASVIKYLSFGFQNTLADYYWINIIQDLSLWNQKNMFYISYYQNLVTLDPKFQEPYVFGLLTVPTKKFPDAIAYMRPLVDTAIQADPTNWKAPYYLGVQYHVLKKSYDDAVHYLAIATRRSHDPMVETAYTSYVKKILKGDEASQAMITIIYNTADSKALKKIAKQQLVINYLTKVFQKAVVDYKIKHHVYPETLAQAIIEKNITLPENFEDEFITEYSRNTGQISITPKPEE